MRRTLCMVTGFPASVYAKAQRNLIRAGEWQPFKPSRRADCRVIDKAGAVGVGVCST